MTGSSAVRRMQAVFAATMFLLSPPALHAKAPRLQVIDQPAEQRLVITIGLDAGDTQVSEIIDLVTSAMAYRFTVEAGADIEWELTLDVAAHGIRSRVAQFGPRSREIRLPRPLGLRLDDGDSIVVSLRVTTTAPATTELRLVVDYEPIGTSVSRLPVLPVESRATNDTVERSWEWQAPADARLVAIAGVNVTRASLLVLRDVATGEVVWRETVQPAAGEAFAAGGGVVRAGVPVRAGRTYRFALIPDGDARADVLTADTPRALLLAAR